MQQQLPLQAGWPGSLELRFEAGGAGTRLALNRHVGPLRLLKSLASEDGRRREAVIVHPPGGLVGGDSLAVALRLGPHARVLATTPGAQKWYRGERPAFSSTRLTITEGALLEWLPQPSILYDGARARQALTIEVDAGGSCMGWEILARGRSAMGEVFESGHIEQTLSISVDKALLWQESLHAEAADRIFDSPLGWDRQRIAASVWCCAPAAAPANLLALRDRWRELLDLGSAAPTAHPGGAGKGASGARGNASGGTRGDASRGTRGGATLAAPGLLLAKLLADDGEQLTTICRQLWRAARISLEAREGSTPRIWRT